MNPTPSSGESAVLKRWLVAGVCSRRGSAHGRRGQPCQDASLQRLFTLPGGLPLTLLAVADGHGAPAYHLSDVGSALACEAAAAVVAAELARLPGAAAAPAGADLLALRRWLAEELPTALQQRWLDAVRQHWQAGPGRGVDGAPFSPQPYGSTLGLLLLTPRWWALAGLGDWDLVRVDQAGEAELVSQELAAPGAGEATASLCQLGASRDGWFRSWLWPLDDQEGPFALVLSTDGIRKSCASDADFLALAAWLAAGPPPGVAGSDPVVIGTADREVVAQGAGVDGFLAEALDRISAEGCGDDGSVAIGRWSAGEEGTLPRSELAAVPAPPPPSPHPPPPPHPPPLSTPRLAYRVLAPLLTGALALLIGVATGQRLPLVLAPAGPQLEARPGLPPASREPLRREAVRLCGDPGLLVANLGSRHSQVQALRRGTLRPERLLTDSPHDPLGALIAASFLEQHPQAARSDDLASLGLCPALRSALARLWLPAAPPAPRPAQGALAAPPVPRLTQRAPSAAPPPRASR